MSLRYVTLTEVRATSGISEKLISDADFTSICEYTEYVIEGLKNTSFTPKTVLEQLQGNNTERIKLKNAPVIKLRKLYIDTDEVDIDAVRYDSCGLIYLNSEAVPDAFRSKPTEQKLVRIKYDYCYFEPSNTQTTTIANITSGNNVNIEVNSSAGFLTNDYIELSGFDSKVEVAKITNVPDGTHITVDNLSQDHTLDTLITKQQVPYIVKRLMQIGCALAGVARVVGSSFDEITSYQLGDYSVTKGEPYTQWRETALQLRKEWDEINISFRVQPSIG